jgi:hypothetical protein
MRKREVIQEVILCACGCANTLLTPDKRNRPMRFIVGHARRLNRPKRISTAKNVYKHGMSKTPEYAAYWHAMRRCTNPNIRNWTDYGGRGIKFLFASFEDFFAHIGPRPEGTLPNGRALYTLDRIDNDGNYELGNVRWATWSEQHKNKRPVTDEARINMSIGRRRHLWSSSVSLSNT